MSIRTKFLYYHFLKFVLLCITEKSMLHLYNLNKEKELLYLKNVQMKMNTLLFFSSYCINLFLFYVRVYLSFYILQVCSISGGHKRETCVWEVEIQMLISSHLGAENQSQLKILWENSQCS